MDETVNASASKPALRYIVFVGQDDVPGEDGHTYSGLWCCHTHYTLEEAADCFIRAPKSPPLDFLAVLADGTKRDLTAKERRRIHKLVENRMKAGMRFLLGMLA